MVAALVGRRIDLPGAEPAVFPVTAIHRVRQRVEQLFKDCGVTVLVCSGACGADLVALEAAGSLGIRRRVFLPFAEDKFRETSVVDRPGDWGPAFDRIMASVAAKGDLTILDLDPDTDASYIETNRHLLKETLALSRASGESASAIVVWNGIPRGDDDVTAQFAATATPMGLRVLEVGTL